MTDIRAIAAAETIAVRWPVLRPGFPRESAIFDGDDLATTAHFGAFDDGRLVGVASLFLAPMPGRPEAIPALQLRGMATLPEVRGRGFGRELLEACVAHAQERAAALLWCNARTGAAPFYERHGWEKCSGEFDIPTVGPHFRMIFSRARGTVRP